MTNTTTWVRNQWAPYRCKRGQVVVLGGIGVYAANDDVAVAYVALWAAISSEGYQAEVIGSHRYCPTGISGRTCQPSGAWCSLHNYDLALDFDPFRLGNPHLQRRWRASDWSKTKFTPAQVAAGEAIRTNSGHQVFRWLGWAIGDSMHWEINCSPAQLATGIDPTTVPNYTGDDDEMTLKRGDQGNAVRKFQNALMAERSGSLPEWGADSDFGPETETAVKDYQRRADLPQTGSIDGVTAALLLEYVEDRVDGADSGTDATARQEAAKANAVAAKAIARLDKYNLK